MEWVVTPEEGHEVTVDNSRLSTVLLLLNTMIGSGILVQPYMFSQTGIIIAFFEYIIISQFLYRGIQMLVRSAELTKVLSSNPKNTNPSPNPKPNPHRKGIRLLRLGRERTWNTVGHRS